MRSPTKDWSRIFVFGVLCVVISLIERLFPPLFPFIKLGLSNVVFLVMIPYFNFRLLAVVLFLKILIPAVILGTFGSLSFVLSAVSSIGAFSVMFLFLAQIRVFSRIAVSTLASIVNISLQIIVVSIYLDVNGIFLLKMLYIPAFIAGCLTGLIAELSLNKLEKIGIYDNKE